jgi:hypothetical protein
MASFKCAYRADGSVDDRDRVDLDQQLGVGKRLHAEHDVGGLVVAEDRNPRI